MYGQGFNLYCVVCLTSLGSVFELALNVTDTKSGLNVAQTPDPHTRAHYINNTADCSFLGYIKTLSVVLNGWMIN